MSKKALLLIFSIAAYWLNANNASAQCAFGGNAVQFPSGIINPNCIGTAQTITTCNFGGDYFLMNVVAGQQYLLSNCGGTWDSQITVYDNATQAFIAFNDDNGPACAGLQASVQWTSTFTGVVLVLINLYDCTTNFSCITTTVTCGAPPPTPANNDCASVTPVPLAVPGALNFTGTSAGSTDNSTGQTYGAAQVWHAFTLSVCANVVINTCGTTPSFQNMFTGISTGCPATFPGNYLQSNSWNFTDCGDGNFTAYYNNLQPGTYWVPVIGSPPDNHAYTLNITSTPVVAQPTINPSGPTTFCAGGSVNLTVPSPGGGGSSDISVTISGTGFLDETSWTLTNSLGTVIGSGGPYAFGSTNNLTVTGSNGPFTFTIETQGTFNDNIANYTVTCVSTGTVMASGTINGGLTSSIPNLDCGAAPLTYTWSPAAGLNTTTGQNVTATPSVTTTYTVTATNTATGCSNNQSITITVNQPPTISVNPSSPSICSGQSVSLTASGASTYNWSPATGLSATTGATVTASPTSNQTYTITGIDGNGCSGTGSVTVNVTPGITVNATATPSTVCAGQPSTLTATGATTYTWSPATDLSATTGASVTATPSSTITYSVTGTDGSGCQGTANVTVTVSAGGAVTLSPFSSVCLGSSAFPLTGGSPAGGTYSGPGVSGGNFDPNVAGLGTHAITYTVTGPCGGTATQNITVDNGANFASVTATPSTFCAGQSTQLAAVLGPAFTQTLSSTDLITIPAGAPGTTVGNSSPFPSNINATGLPALGVQITSVTLNGLSHTFPGDLDIYLTSPSGQTVMLMSDAGGATDVVNVDLTFQDGAPLLTAAAIVSGTYGPTDITPGDAGVPAGYSTTLSTFTGNPNGNWGLFIIDDAGGDVGSLAGWSITFSVPFSATTYTWTASPAGNAVISNPNIQNPTATVTGNVTFTVTANTGTGCNATGTVSVNPTQAVTINSISATPNAICGVGTVQLDVQATTTTPSQQTISGGGSISIPLSGNATPFPSNLTVSGLPTTGVTVASVQINGLSHTFPADIDMYLTSPSGESVYLMSDAGGGNGITNVNLVFQDGAPALTAALITSGTYSPTNLPVAADPGVPAGTTTTLSTFTGNPNGNWGLFVIDDLTGDLGTINSWSITFNIPGSSLTYSWSANPSGNATISNNTLPNPTANITGSVDFTVVVTDLSGCSATQTVSVIGGGSLNVSVTPSSANICPGDNVVITASGATTYTWSPSTGLSATTGATVTASPGSTQTYTVTGTDGSGCSGTATVTVNVSSGGPVTLSPFSPICVNASPLTLTGGSPAGGTFSGPGVSGGQFNPATAGVGTHTITYTISGACGGTATQNITVNPQPTLSPITANPPTVCPGGSSDLSVSGAFSYTWSPATGLSSTIGPNVTATIGSTQTYIVTGTDGNGCSNTQSVTLNVFATPTIAISPASPTICPGASTTLTASGASTFNWSPATGLSATSGATVTASPSSNQTYNVTGTDANGCTGTGTVTVTINSGLTIGVSPAAPAICVGGSGVSLTAIGATNYTWSPSTGLSSTTGSTVTANPATTTTYTVDGNDGAGCTGSTTITVTVNSLPNVTVTSPNLDICTGSSTPLNASGATSYTWSPATGLSATTGASVLASPTTTTIYTVTGTGPGGCTNTATITVNVNALPIVSASATSPTICAGGNTVLTASGANTYTWSPSATLSSSTGTSVTATPATTTTYTVTGLDGNGCSGTGTVTVNVTPNPVVNITAAGPFCNNGTAVSLVATPAGGTWTGSGVNASGIFDPASAFIGNNTVTYTTTVSGCSGTGSINIVVNAAPVPVINPAGPFCTNDPAVNLSASIFGGTWSGTGVSVTGLFNPAVAGPGNASITYTVTVGGCSGTTSTFIAVNQAPNATITPVSPVCNTSLPFFLSAATPGGTWTGSPAVSSSGLFDPALAIIGANSVTYTVIGNGCTSVATANVIVNQTPNATINPVGPFCSNDASVLLSAGTAGGTWSGTGVNAAGLFNPGTATIGVNTISYTVTVAGCSASSTTNILVNAVPNSSITGAGPFCSSSPAVTLNVTTPGGVFSGTGVNSTGTFNPANALIGANTITYTVTSGGCTSSSSTSIIVNQTPNSTIQPAGPFCANQSAVNLVASTSGGTWSGASCLTSAGVFTPSGCGAGTYTVTYSVTLGSCSSSSTSTIVVNSVPNATITPTGPFCSTDPAVTLTAATPGGTWTGTGVNSFGLFIPGSALNGNNTITYTVSNGVCTSTSSTIIVVNNIGNAFIVPVGPYCANSPAVTLQATPAGGTWSGPGVSSGGVFNPATAGAGQHTITYTVGSGSCTSSTSTFIQVDGNPGATILTTGPFCSADSPISLSAAVAGGTWYGPGVTNFGTFNPQSVGAGTYTIGYYITTGLCTASDTATFVVFQTPNANITGPVNLCTDASSVTLTAPTGGGVWSGPGTNPSTGVFNPLTAGAGVHTISYNVTIGICSASDTHVITVNQTPDASITTVGPFCANSAGVQLNSPNPGGVWSGPGTSSSGFFTPSLAGAGSHTITHSVTTSGCTGTSTQTIIVNPTPNSAITPAGPFCAYDAPFQLNAATSGGTWSGTGVNASGLFTPSLSGAGNFIITYSVGSGPCSSTSTTLITVQDAPNASILPAGPFCANQSAVALNVITPGGTFSGPGMNGNLFNPQTANIGSNQITYSVTVGNCSSSSSTTIQVNPLPTAGFDTLTTGNGQITFNNTSTGATSYSWDFGDGTFSDDTNPIHNYDQTGFYSVTVTAINACGSVTFTMTVNVKVDATSVESLGQNMNVNVFPNPAIETITIAIQSKSNEKSMSMRLIDINGKVVRLEKLQLTNGQLNMILPIDDLAFGVYTLQLESGDHVFSKKIVKM